MCAKEKCLFMRKMGNNTLEKIDAMAASLHFFHFLPDSGSRSHFITLGNQYRRALGVMGNVGNSNVRNYDLRFTIYSLRSFSCDLKIS